MQRIDYQWIWIELVEMNHVAWFESPKQFQFDIVAINDIADVADLVHLFKYDTIYGRFQVRLKFR